MLETTSEPARGAKEPSSRDPRTCRERKQNLSSKIVKRRPGLQNPKLGRASNQRSELWHYLDVKDSRYVVG